MGIALLPLIHVAFRAYEIVIIVAVVFSWLRISQYDKRWGGLIRLVRSLTEPLFEPIRRVLQPYQGRSGFDFSPVAAWLIVEIAHRIVVSIVVQYLA